MSFARDLAVLCERAKDKKDIVIRKLSLEIYSSLVMKSPVDTGRFRGNWQVGDRSMNLTTTSAPDPSGGGATARAAGTLQTLKLGGVIYLTNSLPYAKRLEHGWSQQAPSGMVRVTVAEFGQLVAKAAGSVK